MEKGLAIVSESDQRHCDICTNLIFLPNIRRVTRDDAIILHSLKMEIEVKFDKPTTELEALMTIWNIFMQTLNRNFFDAWVDSDTYVNRMP